MASLFTDSNKGKSKKRTRQGMGRGTKWGTKPTGKASKKPLGRRSGSGYDLLSGISQFHDQTL